MLRTATVDVLHHRTGLSTDVVESIVSEAKFHQTLKAIR
jgi:hypothetical protein